MKKKRDLFIFSFLILLCCFKLNPAEAQSTARLGIESGAGKQPLFPFSSPDYSYIVQGYRLSLNLPLKRKGRISYEFQIEPGVYSASHRLLNEYFIKPSWGSGYLEERKRLMASKTIMEYALNLGFQVRYYLNSNFRCFILAGTGPMVSDTDTERMAKGFAFSDVFALGVAYSTGKIMFEVRPGLRHVSNAGFRSPNSGYNSSNIDFGITVAL